MSTKIEYLDESINPIQDTRKGKSGRGYHCTKCSPGCQNCWAEAMNMRFGNGQPFDDTPVKFEIIESELAKLQKWKKPRYVGIQFMGDSYHPDVDEWINSYIYGELYINSQHKYLLLTKQAELMQTFFLGRNIPPHIHGGLTVCNQQEADEKIPIFLQIPFATHVLSIEPLLGPVDLDKTCSGKPINNGWCWREGIDWVIAGCESGPNRRPAKIEWFRDLKNKCVYAGVPFFLKQMGTEPPGMSWIETGIPMWYENFKATVIKMPYLDGRQWAEMP